MEKNWNLTMKYMAHWRHGLKKNFGLALKPIPRDIKSTFQFHIWAKKHYHYENLIQSC